MHRATLHKVFIAKEMLLCTLRRADGSTFISGHVKQSHCAQYSSNFLTLLTPWTNGAIFYYQSTSTSLKIFSTAQSIIIHGESDLAYRLSACEEFERVNH